MNAVKKTSNAIHLFMTYFGILQLLAMTIIVSANVFCRFALGFTISWADEVPLVLVVWFSMISMALGVKMKLHISIEMFTMKLSDKIKKEVIDRISAAVTLIFGIVLFYYGILIVQNGMTSTLAATGLPTAVEYIFVPIAGFMIIFDSIMDLFLLDSAAEFELKLMGGEENA
jgi:TRAP-type C4-dicarboxylate transport system permease small subunit